MVCILYNNFYGSINKEIKEVYLNFIFFFKVYWVYFLVIRSGRGYRIMLNNDRVSLVEMKVDFLIER